jgi:predicted amidophosphoribosyltransferase
VKPNRDALPVDPDSRPISICPHCWEVNRRAPRLCGRCGADMTLLLQESGGLRATAAVQSPVPVRVGARLSPIQRILVLVFVAILFAAQIMSAIYAAAWRFMPTHRDPIQNPATEPFGPD